MRVLLQNFETGLYLDPRGTWTMAPEQAQSFPNTRQATEFKVRHRLANTFVVVVAAPAAPAKSSGQRSAVTIEPPRLG